MSWNIKEAIRGWTWDTPTEVRLKRTPGGAIGALTRRASEVEVTDETHTQYLLGLQEGLVVLHHALMGKEGWSHVKGLFAVPRPDLAPSVHVRYIMAYRGSLGYMYLNSTDASRSVPVRFVDLVSVLGFLRGDPRPLNMDHLKRLVFGLTATLAHLTQDEPAAGSTLRDAEEALSHIHDPPPAPLPPALVQSFGVKHLTWRAASGGLTRTQRLLFDR